MHHTIRGPGKKAGAYTYILETEINGKVATLTDTGVLEPMSENKAELVILLKALKRLRKECDLDIIGVSIPFKTSFEEWLDKWKKANWKNAKGKDVANAEYWQQVVEFKDKYNISISDQEEHQYKKWMIAETEKKMKGVKDGD